LRFRLALRRQGPLRVENDLDTGQDRHPSAARSVRRGRSFCREARMRDVGGRMKDADELMRFAPVIPVLVIDDASYALPVAEALVSGGLRVLEVTLRTPAALEVIRAMSKVRGAIVGAGTVLNERDLGRSLDVGAKFIVSPGLTESLARTARDSGV